jgi:hypothetical protein
MHDDTTGRGWLARRRRARVLGELERLEAAHALLHAELDHALDAGSWESLGETYEERSSGASWMRQVDALRSALERNELEQRRAIERLDHLDHLDHLDRLSR